MALNPTVIDARIYTDSEGRQRTGRGRNGHKPVLITMHIQQGTNYLPDFFKGEDADSTAWVTLDGKTYRMLNDEDTPWTNGDVTAPNMANPVIAALVNSGVTNTNDYALTIEHQGMPNQVFPDAQIEASAQLTAYWCQKFNIPADRNHIIGHYEVGPHKNCPSATFPFDKLIQRVNQILTADTNSTPAPQPKEEVHFFKETGHSVGHGFLDFYLSFGGYDTALRIFGLPLTDEYTDPKDGLVTQDFERAIFKFHPEIQDPAWRVQTVDAGRQLRAAQANQANPQQVIDLQNQVAALQKQVNDLSAAGKTKDAQIAQATVQISQLNTTLAKVQGQADSRYQEIMGLKAQVAQLQAQLDTLQNGGSGSGNSGSGGGVTPDPKPVPSDINWAAPVRVWNTALWRPSLLLKKMDGAPFFLGETGSAAPASAVVLFDVKNPQNLVKLNDRVDVVGAWPHGAFLTDGTGRVAWRHRDPGFVGYMRLIDAQGNPMGSGWGLSPFAGTGQQIDQPAIASSPDGKVLYCVGQIQKSPPALGFAESTDGGQTFHGYIELASNRPDGSGDLLPHIAVGLDGTIHVAYLWNNSLWATSRYKGVWNTPVCVANGPADNWLYRSIGGVGGGADGTGYCVANSNASFVLGRFTPLKGWETVSKDALKGVSNPRDCAVTATPDGRVWVACGYDTSVPSDGFKVAVSNDRGASFSYLKTVVPHTQDIEVVDIQYSPVSGKVVAAVTFKDPRESYVVYTA